MTRSMPAEVQMLLAFGTAAFELERDRCHPSQANDPLLQAALANTIPHIESVLKVLKDRVAAQPQPAENCWSTIQPILKDREELQVIVDKLEKTIDGVSIVPGVDKIWCGSMDEMALVAAEEEPNETVRVHCTWCDLPVSEHYSSRKAAEAAT